MKVDDIVFAPFKDNMWPGRIVSLGVMAQIKFYKIKEHFKVPIKSLKAFDAVNIALNLEKNHEKRFALAVKMAEVQLKKKINRSDSVDVKIEPIVKSEEDYKVPMKMQQVTQHQMLAVKQEEEQVENVNHLPAYNTLLDYLLSLNEEELVKLAKKEQMHEWIYFNPQKREKCSYTSNPVFQILRLTQFMLARLLTLKNSNKQTIVSYQRKINVFLCNVAFQLQILLSRDVIKLIKIVTEYHETNMLKWKNQSFIQSLKNFKEATRVRIGNDLVDYSKLGPLTGHLAKYRFLPKDPK